MCRVSIYLLPNFVFNFLKPLLMTHSRDNFSFASKNSAEALVMPDKLSRLDRLHLAADGA
jgi:hypothetical protein